MKSARNKQQDFEVLRRASELLQDQLRYDERVPDLADQISERVDASSHHYFVEPYLSSFGVPQLSNPKFIPLASKILDDFRAVECASFMGIIPEINRAWITIDNKLYLWDYLHPTQFLTYDGLTEVIISASLSAPKPGVFVDGVRYVLVLATSVDVVLLGIVWEKDYADLHLRATQYAIPSDNVSMFKVIGSQLGRIFMGGSDGNLYELVYDKSDAVSSWSLFGAQPNSKCRKLNHSSWNWKLVHIIPPFLRELSGLNESICDVVIDDVRNLLYSISSKGNLGLFYLGKDGSGFVNVLTVNLFDELFAALSANPRECSPKADHFRNCSMRVISMFVVPPTESKSVHLVIFLSTGIRVYLTVLSSDNQPFFKEGSIQAPPTECRIAYVRNPPPVEALNAVSRKEHVVNDAFLPTYLPSQQLNVHTALYSSGVAILAVGKDAEPDRIIGLTEDLVSRSQTLSLSSGAPQTQLPSLREAVSVLSPTGTASSAPGSEGKVYDIRENCALLNFPDSYNLRTLYLTSKSPAATPAALSSAPAADSTPSGRIDAYSGYGAALVSSLGAALIGLSAKNARSIHPLSELSTQMAPSASSSRRQFLLLSNRGLLVVDKMRPIDILYGILEWHCADEEYIERARLFFAYFGLLQSAAMCLAIALHLPVDLGQVGGDGVLSGALSVSNSHIQRRAIAVMQRLSEGPSFRTASLLPSVQDSRYSVSGNTIFFLSTAHDAMQLVLSRILRPLWFKPIASAKGIAPFITRKLIAAFLRPLSIFRDVLLDYYTSVVQSNYSDLSAEADKELEDKEKSSNILMRQMQLQSRTPKDQEKIWAIEARRREDTSILSLYRLLCRCIQGLSLIDILLAAELEMKVKVTWNKFDNTTFCSFVSTMATHDKIQKFIDDLLSTKGMSGSGGVSSVSDRLTELLKTMCFSFYSAGDKYRYEAFKIIDEAVELMSSGSFAMPQFSAGKASDLDALINKAIQLLLKACKYWRSVDDVFSSPAGPSILKRCCVQLSRLSNAGRDAVVDLCIATAQNFADAGGSLIPGQIKDPSELERDLYHCGAVSSDVDRIAARSACYKCLVEEIKAVDMSHVKDIGSGFISSGQSVNSGSSSGPSVVAPIAQSAVVQRMVQRCLSKCSDSEFLTILFSSLYEWNRSLLFTLQSRPLEQFLRSKDPLDLYTYFELHSRFGAASAHLSDLALADADLDIALRIHYLALAVSSAERYEQLRSAEDMKTSDDHLAYIVRELRDRLTVAEYQRSIHSVLQVEADELSSSGIVFEGLQKKEFTALLNLSQRLKVQLKTLTELYLEVKTRDEPYKLWEMSLQLLFIAKSDDFALVSRLWRSIIYRTVPDSSRINELSQFLESKRTPQLIDFDLRKQRQDVPFEQVVDWVGDLSSKITSIGTAVRGAEVAYAFPVAVVVEEVEDICLALKNAGVCDVSDKVAVVALEKIGVSYGAILDEYASLLSRWESRRSDAIVFAAHKITLILSDWIQAATMLSAKTSNELRQLLVAIRHQKVQFWVGRCRQALNSVAAHSLLSNSAQRDLADSLSNIRKVEEYVNSVLLV